MKLCFSKLLILNPKDFVHLFPTLQLDKKKNN